MRTRIALAEVVAAARAGARKAGETRRADADLEDLASLCLPEYTEVRFVDELAPICTPDTDEARFVEAFILDELARQDDGPLIQVEARLRREDRSAVGWYLRLLRECVGVHERDDSLTFLVFVPIVIRGGMEGCPDLRYEAEPLARSLEGALDLGSQSLALSPQAYSFEVLERLKPLAWRALSETLPTDAAALPKAPFKERGALVGAWHVDRGDKTRLAFRHGLQRDLSEWTSLTQARLNANAPERVRISPPVLLFEFFTTIRQLALSEGLTEAYRECGGGARLTWQWNDGSGELAWQLASSEERAHRGQVDFADEPRALVMEHFARVARQLNLI